MTPDDPMLMAYADGELDGAEAAAVAAAVAADPALAAAVERHRALRMRLGSAFAAVLDEPVPDRLLPSATVVSFRPRRSVVGWVAGASALAASLVLGVTVGHRQRPAADGVAYASGPLAQALERQLGGDPGPARVLVSFRDGGGRVCRVYASTGEDGIACHTDLGWALVTRAPGSQSMATAYRQAGSASPIIMARAEDMMKGPAFGRGAEEQARKRGWR